jgi:hypothetical protein
VKQAKPKRVSFELIQRDSVIGHPMYCLLDELVDAYHRELQRARIALAWCTSWNADVDGRVTLGKCKRAGDLDRELASFDFVILLRQAFWTNEQVTAQQRRALLDHELCHAAVKLEPKSGEPVVDERDRLVYRTRRHDIEEFTEIVERYGCWTHEIEAFYAALRRAGQEPFTHCPECQPTPGWVPILDSQGVWRQSRCPCWLKWQELRKDAVSA